MLTRAELPHSVRRMYATFVERYPRQHPDHNRVMEGVTESVVFIYEKVNNPRTAVKEPAILESDPFGFIVDKDPVFGRISPLVSIRRDFETQKRRRGSNLDSDQTSSSGLRISLIGLPFIIPRLAETEKARWLQGHPLPEKLEEEFPSGGVLLDAVSASEAETPRTRRLIMPGTTTFRELAAEYPELSEYKIRELINAQADVDFDFGRDGIKIFQRQQVVPVIARHDRAAKVSRAEIVVKEGQVYASTSIIALTREDKDQQPINRRVQGLPYVEGYGSTNKAHLYPLRNVLMRFDDPQTDIKEGLEQDSEQKWYNTIASVDFKESVRYLRLVEGYSRNEFSRLTGLANSTLESAEVIGAISLRKLNTIIKLSTIDQNGKAAQLLRVKSLGEQPMTVNELREADFGKVFKYLRIINGMSQEMLAEKLSVSGSWIGKIEKGRTLPEGILSVVDNWLNLQPAFKEVLRRTLHPEKPIIEQELLNKVVDERLLFVKGPDARREEGDTSSPNIARAIRTAETVGHAFDVLGESGEVTADQIWEVLKIKFKNEQIEALKTRALLPLDFVLAEFMFRLGFDIHHPYTHAMVGWGNEKRVA